MNRRAIGIVRVSETKGREGESFASPHEQLDRIRAACERDGLHLIETYEELDVSGRRPLDQRPGLSQAVRAIEAGEADVVAAAYFDRLFRSLSTKPRSSSGSSKPADKCSRSMSAASPMAAPDSGSLERCSGP